MRAGIFARSRKSQHEPKHQRIDFVDSVTLRRCHPFLQAMLAVQAVGLPANALPNLGTKPGKTPTATYQLEGAENGTATPFTASYII
jgi:hypothetical protein